MNLQQSLPSPLCKRSLDSIGSSTCRSLLSHLMGQSTSRIDPDAPGVGVSRRTSRLRPASLIFGSRQERELRTRHHSADLLPRFLSRDGPPPEPASQSSSSHRRHSRFARARTFTTTIPSIFTRHRPSSSHHRAADMLPPLPSYRESTRSTANNSDGTFLPDVHIPDIDLTFEPARPEILPTAQPEPRRQEHRPHTSIADRIAALTPDRGFRSVTAPLRRRRSPLRRGEDHAVMLSRLLSVAAAATAATLMGGNPEAAIRDLRSSNDVVSGDDGTFEHFLQTLRNGQLASALGQDEGSATNVAGRTMDRSPASLDFFRMFRFGTSNGPASTARWRNADSPRPDSSRSLPRAQDNLQDRHDEDNGEGRMIPILIVGIRSLNPESDGAHDATDTIPSFLDALTSFPTTINIGLSDDPLTDGLLRQSRSGVRVSQRRRASMGGLNLFSRDRDPPRYSRSTNTVRPRSEARLSVPSQTPPGPFAPPTTPASPGLSAFSSGYSTPSGRNSTSSTAANASSRPESFATRTTGTTLEPTAEEPPDHPRPPRSRRLSESDFIRFGSGSSRRNGVHLPSLESEDSPTEGNRSWIIYVLGGSYPENHPILTTPSLFTDSPTYEDMLLLSTLLGPAKPPVASAEDVAAASGLYKISILDGNVFAVAVDGEERVPIPAGERCLVCLCDYEVDEETRRLIKCDHFFHRECIDQVSHAYARMWTDG